MTRSFAPLSVVPLVGATATATFASVGLVFLVFGPVAGPVPMLTVPLGALLLTGLMLTTQEAGRSEAKPKNAREPAGAEPVQAVSVAALGEHFLGTEFAAALRGRAISVVRFRIDEFEKRAIFHDGASEGLQLAAFHVLRRCTRTMCFSLRDEAEPGTYMSILSNVDVHGARVFVEKVRREMATIQIAGKPLTVSAGVAAFDYSMSTPNDLVHAADVALRRVTREGGNKVGYVSSGLIASGIG